MKYAWINEYRSEFPVRDMCRVMGVSRSGFYDSLNRPPSERSRRGDRIRKSVAQAHQETDAIYGATKIAEELKHRDDLETACRNTVAQAMKELGIRSKVGRKAFRPTTTQVDPSKRSAANILDREFTATAPNQKWVTDITYLATSAGWVYLAAVIDLFGRKVVGWSVSQSLATDLVQAALRDVIEKRRGDRETATGWFTTAASQRPRLPVHQPGVSADAANTRHHLFDVRDGQLLRQRGRRTVLLEPEVRMDKLSRRPMKNGQGLPQDCDIGPAVRDCHKESRELQPVIAARIHALSLKVDRPRKQKK